MRSDNHHRRGKVAAKAAPPDRAGAAERRHLDELLDEGLKGTFPASDLIAVVQQPPEPPKAKPSRRAHEN